MDRLPDMLCERALSLTVLTISAHACLAGQSGFLSSKSLAGLYYLQTMEAAHVQTQLRDTLESLLRESVTHRFHQASHAGSHNGNFRALVNYASILPIIRVEYTICLRLLDTYTSDLLLLEHLDPIEAGILRIDATCLGHRGARHSTQPRPLIQFSVSHPGSAAFVDPQGLTALNELEPCGPSGMAAVCGDVFQEDPHQTIRVLFYYCEYGVMR
ncbi:MAG: hypothetical protein ALECFALPRED_005886 [Alectoria fallacina]|uniref:Uncharacterized protein n=1 Tax=Alectoria fallacina TaxID=1903189 RepID=A0A8H3G087_9LECA|nr:MAG: hypothetical protein ALECFALPRED_005886 [Alectoria fallacina]